MTAQEAIETSAREDRIIHLAWEHQAQTDLMVACDDWTDGNNVREYWGTTENGSHWRVHMDAPVGEPSHLA